MKDADKTIPCGSVRRWLADTMNERFDIAGRLRRHVEQCPRCRERMMRNARLRLAMQLLKAQPQPMNLLLECNRLAIACLKRDVRELPLARNLRTCLPKVPLRVRLTAQFQAVTSAAACLLVLLLARMATISMADKVHDQSKQAMEQYCRHIEEATDSHDLLQ
ncbi:MAG: hypothetical protein EHM48_01285 [Planctomycetaceae bacterium]|nr:MAG: hypothetical protein EHM48_01285 [Planctomycetaceae bacterium]